MSDDLKHFLKLAKRGSGNGASGGEKRAYRLAKAIEADAAGLDIQALNGLIDFVKLAAEKPWVASDLCPE